MSPIGAPQGAQDPKDGVSLEELARQLAAVSHELETIGSVLSHDLRAPVRSIEGFSRLMLKSHAAHLDETGQEYLGRIHAASLRLARMIDELLQLTRVARGGIRSDQVDLSVVAAEILASLLATAPERKVQTRIEPGLQVVADARLIRLALEQLLGNAWKFTRGVSVAVIEFGRCVHEGSPALFVQDNGAGFEQKYADKLFRAFARLHSESDFEGSGLGLATVQRIVHAHGGRMWAQGQTGGGARIMFMLPGAAGA